MSLKPHQARVESRLGHVSKLLGQGKVEPAVEILFEETKNATRVCQSHALLLNGLLKLDRVMDAREVFEQTMRLPAETADALDALAFYARQLGQHERSNALYRRAAQLAPGDSQLWFNLATSERTLGNLNAALVACGHALAIDPSALPALLLRSEVIRATDQSNHIEELQKRLSTDLSVGSQIFVAYALGKELHDLARYDAAFEAFVKGASARRRNLSYDVLDDERKLARIAGAYSSLTDVAQVTDGARHIFIIGLPRSGTTLTERILTNLPGVRSNGETDNFSKALLANAKAVGGDIFDRCAQGSTAAVALDYEARATQDGFDGKIIEKLPMNYLYAGAIARALPAAAIISVRRHPLDSCFAMFRTLFGLAYPFSYDFEDLARYYSAYDRLQTHWRRTLEGRLLEVDYESLVSEPESVGAKLAAHCGVPWSAAAVDITRNRTASLTASAAQVREPIYQRSAGIWRSYRRQLEPLSARLRELGVVLPDD